MKAVALRIDITQSQAVYRVEETVESQMTYPLPPPSTLIGALHVACGYKTYHPMDVSIQGKFVSMQQEMFHAVVPHGTVKDDRGILYYTILPQCYNSGSIMVAQANTMSASFSMRKDVTIYDEELFEQYLEEKRTKRLNKPHSHFMNVVRPVRYAETLYDVRLTIHIISTIETLKDIQNNIHRFNCLGRSEDFAEAVCTEVYLVNVSDITRKIHSPIGYSGYINPFFINNGIVEIPQDLEIGSYATLYCLSKNYKVVKGKREFERIWASYATDYSVSDISVNRLFSSGKTKVGKTLWVDIDNDDNEYIVNFL